MTTSSTQPAIDPTSAIADAVGRRAREEGRTPVAVAEGPYYRALFDRYLADTAAPDGRDRVWRRELFEVLLRQTKNAVREVARRAGGAAARETASPELGAPARDLAGARRV